MLNFWLLTKKNLRLLLRAKWSALIVFIAPLLLILILGLSYNTSDQYGLSIGIYSPEQSSDVIELSTLLEEQEFTVTHYDNITACLQTISQGKTHACLEVPVSLQIEENSPKEIVFHLDPSNINLVWMVQQTLDEKFSLKSQQIAEELSQDTLTRLQEAKVSVTQQHQTLTTTTEQASTAATATAGVASGLKGLDLSVSNSSINLTLISTLETDLAASQTKLAEAKDAVQGASLNSSEESTILGALNAAESGVDSALLSLSNDTTFSTLTSEIEKMRTQLQAASTAISTSSGDLSTAQTALSQVQTSVKNVQSALATVQSSLEGQKVTDAGTLVAPLSIRIETATPESTYLNYLFPGLLVLVIMFTSLLLGTTLVMMEKNSPAFLRNFFMPISKVTFITSTYVTNLILIICEVIVILLVSLAFLKSGLAAYPAVALVLFLAASVFTFLGMAIGYLFANEETGILGAISLGSIMLFLSGIILPLEGISQGLRNVAAFNPFVVAENMIRELFLFGSSLGDVWVSLLILLAYVVGLFLIVLLLESVLHQHLVHRFLRHHQRKHKRKPLTPKHTK